MAHYFIFNDISSRDMHVLIASPIEIIKPEERVNHVTLPGRCGELTQTEGDHIYNSYIQTVPISVYGSEFVRPVEKWLSGGGYVTFSSQPDLKQRARVINAVTLKKHSKNINAWTGDVQFYCEPVKGFVGEEDIEITESGTTVTNPGDLTAYPLITVEGSGTVTITMGGNILTIPNLVDGWVVDSEMQWITNNGVPQMNAWSGNFPALPAGNSTVMFTGGITKLTITPRWRVL